MIKSISYWSVAGGLSGERPVEEAVLEARGHGFKGIELAIAEKGVFTPFTDDATCARYRAAVGSQGLILETVACGVSWGCSPTSPDPTTRSRSVELHKRALERVAAVGAKAMLFVPGAVKIPWDPGYGPVRYDRALGWAKEAVGQLVETADRVGVDLCVENVWNGLFYSPLEFAQFVDGFGTGRVGVYFDVGNVLGYQQHPPHWIEMLGRRIKRVHVKDFKSAVGGLGGFCDLLDGDVPWEQTMQALRAIGYEGTVVAEMMPPAPGLLERTSKAMDRILAM